MKDIYRLKTLKQWIILLKIDVFIEKIPCKRWHISNSHILFRKRSSSVFVSFLEKFSRPKSVKNIFVIIFYSRFSISENLSNFWFTDVGKIKYSHKPLDRPVKMVDEILCIESADKSLFGKVDGNFESRISNAERFIVVVLSNLKFNKKAPIVKNCPVDTGPKLSVHKTFSLRPAFTGCQTHNIWIYRIWRSYF